MDWELILQKGAPIVIAMIQSAITNFHAPTRPAAPVPVDDAPAGTVASPDEFIKHLQSFLNLAVKPNPLLVVDGWLGDRTRAAGEAGIAMLEGMGVGK